MSSRKSRARTTSETRPKSDTEITSEGEALAPPTDTGAPEAAPDLSPPNVAPVGGVDAGIVGAGALAWLVAVAIAPDHEAADPRRLAAFASEAQRDLPRRLMLMREHGEMPGAVAAMLDLST